MTRPAINLTTYRRLVVGRAVKSTRTEIAHDLIVAAITTIVLTALLYLGAIGKTFAMDEIRSWLIFVLGVAIFVVISFGLNLFRSAHAVWASDQEQLDAQRETISDLERRMTPTIAVIPSMVGHRFNADRSWMTVTMVAYNTGIDAAIDCYVKLAAIWSIAVAQPGQFVPAFGTTLPWTDRNNALTCTIAGGSNESLGFAVREITTPDQWYLYTDAQTKQFPLHEGIWGITIEVGAVNIAARRSDWRITYLGPDNFLMEPMNPPQPQAVIAQAGT